MPTYKNKSSQMVSVGEFTFSPGEEKPVNQQYLLPISPIVKTSETPEIINPFKLIFQNIDSKTSMSMMFNLRHTMILKVTDGDVSGSVGDNITITAFAGITDNIVDFIPINSFTFKRMEFQTFEGDDLFLWGVDPILSIPKINPQLVDKVSEFITLQITDFSGSGQINVYYKAF